MAQLIPQAVEATLPANSLPSALMAASPRGGDPHALALATTYRDSTHKGANYMKRSLVASDIPLLSDFLVLMPITFTFGNGRELLPMGRGQGGGKAIEVDIVVKKG